MSIETSLTTYEHRTLVSGSTELPQQAYEAFAKRIGIFRKSAPGALELAHNGLRTGSHCGVLSAGEWSLEILPKIDAQDTQQDCRSLLLRMIGTCFDVPLWVDQPTNTALGTGLLEILIQTFLREVGIEFKKGLIRRYAEKREENPFLRGRLDVLEHIRASHAGGIRLPGIFDELTVDNTLNRVIKYALRLCMSKTKPTSPLRKSIHTHLSFLEDVEDIAFSSSEITKINLDRLAVRYSKILTFAKWIIATVQPDVCHGPNEGYGFVFNMNALFEEYVANVLSKAIRKLCSEQVVTIRTQHGNHRILAAKINGCGGSLWIRPDIQILVDDEIKLILDTKWKQFDGQAPASSDAYQMLAYGYGLNCDQLELLYPSTALGGSEVTQFEFRSHGAESLRLNARMFNLRYPIDSSEEIIASLR